MDFDKGGFSMELDYCDGSDIPYLYNLLVEEAPAYPTNWSSASHLCTGPHAVRMADIAQRRMSAAMIL